MNTDAYTILDTRKKEEFEVSHLPGAIWVGEDVNQFSDTQILKNVTILLRVLSKDQNYSESVFINKSTGEMLHEITTEIKSETKGKKISFYNCDASNNI